MDSAKINDWMQVVGIFAVVASLIFVGLQMKQTHEIALASQYQARAESTMEVLRILMESDRGDFRLSRKPREEWTPAEHSFSFAFVSHLWLQYDNHHYQYVSGFLDEEAWVGLEIRISNLWRSCENRWIYESTFKPAGRSSFNDYLQTLDDPCSPEDYQRPGAKTNSSLRQ